MAGRATADLTGPAPAAVGEPAILAEGLSRAFGGVRALQGLDLTAPAGRVVALVGPNGAGKTTLLLILAGLLAPDGGRVRVAGADPLADPLAVRRAVGWMPDFFGVYEGLTAQEYLELFGAAYRLPRAERPGRARELLVNVGLEDRAEARIDTLSRGQKQRLGFARAIVHRPSVLLLDEPASGLDPRARVALRDQLRAQAAGGACVLVSSHILSELEEVADAAVFMEAGRVTGEYAVGEVSAAATSQPWTLRALDHDALARGLEAAGVTGRAAERGEIEVDLGGEEAAAELIARLVGAGVRLVEASPRRGGLERAFLTSGEAERPR